MSTVPQVRRNIRRALEGALKTMAAAQAPPIGVEIPGLSFTRDGLPRFFNIIVHYGPAVIETIGHAPRISMTGYAAIGCFTAIPLGPDASDDLGALVGPAYPYDANLAFGGVSVNISALESRDAAEIDSWRFFPVIVPWTVYRVA